MSGNRRPTVTLYYHTNTGHTQQAHTGFEMLHRAGAIRLRQRLARDDHHRQPLHGIDFSRLRPQTLFALVERTGAPPSQCFYDLSDGPGINTRVLKCVDHYFKRTLLHGSWDREKKISPYGLNFCVHPPAPDLWRMARQARLQRGFKKILQAAKCLAISYQPNIKTFALANPHKGDNQRILFLVRAWEQTGSKDRETINHVRASCIMALRQAFGPAFTGGFIPTDFAKQRYPDLLAPSADITRQENYLALVKGHGVCIATEGLHRSIGWKFAEYVALGRAIVAEKMEHVLPGDITAEKNYLQFTTPGECVTACRSLSENSTRRQTMMAANERYYQRYLRADRLIANTINRALGSEFL